MQCIANRPAHETALRGFAVILSAAFATLAACASTGPSQTEASSEAAAAEPAPHPILGQTLSIDAPRIWSEWESAPPSTDARFDLTDHRGSVVLVHFWASWCEPCRRTMPYYDQLLKAHSEEPLEVVAVNTDDDRGVASIFLEEVPVSFVNVYDERRTICGAYDVTHLPLTALLDRKGVVRHVWVGRTLEDKVSIEAAVSALLAAR